MPLSPMIRGVASAYGQPLHQRTFRAFWLSFTFSALGDAMTHVALTWYVYELTHSAEALGLLSLTYTGPVILGGLLAGPLLDRFDKRRVMMADNLIRGFSVLLIPLLHALNLLSLWHIYAISTIYGSLMMISLAGSPALVPDMVEEEHLATANALETLSFTLSAIIGPPIVGFLIPLISAPNIIIVDALSYFIFAWVLMRLQLSHRAEMPLRDSNRSYGISDALRLLRNTPVLLATTLMFMSFNLGLGILLVALPILTDQVLKGGSVLYGILLGAMAVGEVMSAFLAGSIKLPVTLGRAICGTQLASGIALALLTFQFSPVLAVLSLMLLGFFSAPLTIWAQTLRMKIIPSALRGRTFALLRTLMQATTPLGGVVGGVILPMAVLPEVILISALLMGMPGVVGFGNKALRDAE